MLVKVCFLYYGARMTLTDIAKRLNKDHRAKRLNKDHGAKRLNKDHGHLPPVFFITDQQAVPSPEKVISRLPKGSGVILRDYDHPAREKLGAALAKICRDRNIIFLVAQDAELGIKLEADGVHLPERCMDWATDIRASYPHWMITASCHDRSSIMRAEALPVNACLIAPVFPTYSHPETFSGQAATLGLSGVQDMTAATNLPLYALGGVTNENARQLIGSGVVGIAAIRGFDQD